MSVKHCELWDRHMRQRSIDTRNALAEAYLPHARRIALAVWQKLPATVGEPEELFGLATEGLLTAIERYDPAQPATFETFSTYRIHGAIQDGLRKLDHVPRSARLREKTHDTPVKRLCSLQALAGDDGDIGDLAWLSYADSERADEFWTEACRGLSKTERLIVLLYYRCELTMKEVGKSLGLCESRICQLHARILAKIRDSAVGRRRALLEKS